MAEKEYIEREAFVESQHNIYCINCDRRKDSKGKFVYFVGDAPCRSCGIMDVLDAVEDAPAADVRPVVRGKWYWDKDGMDWGIGSWRCSECHARPGTWWQGDSTNPRNKSGHYFCPNCGADMREENKDV